MQNKSLKTLAILIPVLLVVMVILMLFAKFVHSSGTIDYDTEYTTQIDDVEMSFPAIDPSVKSELVIADPNETIESEDSEDEDAEGTEVSSAVTMVFAGDVLLGDRTLPKYQSSGISGILSDDLKSIMTSADICMVNEEFPYSTRGTKAEDKQYTFRADPKYVTALSDMGADIVTLANNHILDFGADALLDSCDTLDAAGIFYTGAGKNLDRAKQLQIIEKNGMRFGFLAASRVWPVAEWAATDSRPGCFGTYDPAALISEIKAAREKCDFLTVYVHWGIERQSYPEDYQKNMAKQYIEAGCDLVIGSHPHCLQGIEYFDGKPVFYSLGNYIFGQDTNQTAAIKVTIPHGYDSSSSSSVASVKYEVIPAAAHNAFTYMTEGDEALRLYNYMESISYSVSVGSDGTVTNTK